MRAAIAKYETMEQNLIEKYHIKPKQERAIAIAKRLEKEKIPKFFEDIKEKLLEIENGQ